MKDAITYANEAGFFEFNVVGWKAEFERLIETVRADALAELATVKESLTAQDHSADTGNKVPDHIADAGKVILTAEAAQQIEKALWRVTNDWVAPDNLPFEDGEMPALDGAREALESIRAARAQGQWPFSREFLVNQILCSLQIRMEVTNVVDATDGKHLRAELVRTKYLADDELNEIIGKKIMDMRMTYQDLCRAAIAADREKNKC